MSDLAKAASGDPTLNVRELVESLSKRQDDLRELQSKVDEERIRRLEEVATIRAEHAKEMRDLESKRLDAIRQVDVLNQSVAAERQLTAIQTLAATTTANAEALRSMVATTQTTLAAQTANANAAVNERLAMLERSSYEGKGKQAVADPLMDDVLKEVRNLRTARAGDTGGSEALARARQQTIALVSVILAAAGVAIALIAKLM